MRCECGREWPARNGNLRSGTTTSCGRRLCCERGSTNRYAEPGDQAANFVYGNYQADARKKGREWTLTRDDFDRLTAADCRYCGTPPSNRLRDKNGPGMFVYNGLDRIDSTGGYTCDNVTPCCAVCNRAKTDLPLDEFIAWARRVARKHPR